MKSKIDKRDKEWLKLIPKPKQRERLANEYASHRNVSWAKKEWTHDVKTFLAGFQACLDCLRGEL